eukprot:GFUD01041698.1.p1 GENE.GFUD01041698.1~~GFUD01041698.1.p1  ORF type:complete len:849 (+),score=259.17 GFUD01041698.1:41-2587(+)
MLIEQQEELKQWLTSHLEPLCDADPAALAKYVLALIKKDKPVEELKDSMVQQMDVFLQSETNSFVDMLFKVVETKEYANSLPVTEPIKDDTEPAKTEDDPTEPKIEADSTTPIRDFDKYSDPRSSSYDDRKRFRTSPARDRRITNRLGPRDPRDPPRRFRSRSRSLSPRHDRFRSSRRRSRSPNMERRRRSPDMVSRRVRSVDRERNNSRDSTPTRDEGAAGYTPTAKKPRCRDYDEKGFCLRGDLCKFDHGTDAVVLEDSAKTLGAPGYQPGAATTEPYVPGVPVSGIPFPPPVLSVPPPGYPQYGGKRAHEGGGYEPPAKRFDYARLGRGRGRGRGGRGGRGGASSMLAVRNIPTELNTITHLNGHFSRYGNLVNVQVQFEGDSGSALVTFSETEEANAAFNTSEAVMNNRFIKVFWHMEKGHVKERLGQHNNANMVLVHGDRLTKTVINEEASAAEGENGDAEKVKEDKAQAILAIQKNQEMLQTKHDLLKQAEEKRKSAMLQQEGLLKSKHDLLDGLIEQQKALIVKLEKGRGTIKPEEKAKIMKLLKELSSSIDRTKEDIKTSLSVGSMKNRTKTEIQTELLDAEMELFTKQQDGGPEILNIQQKVNNLRIEAARSGLLPTSRPPRGRGGYRGRARGFSPSPRGSMSLGGGFRGRGRGRGFTLSPGNTNLDRRPSRILVSGYELEEKEEIVNHFTKFGEIVDTVQDEVTPSIILKFKTRRFAEAAMTTGKNFCDKSLTLSWYNQATPDRETGEVAECTEEVQEEEDDGYTPPQEDYLPPGLQEDDTNFSQAVQQNDDQEEDGNEELNVTEEGAEELNEDLLDDEEDDREDEERSWKRRNNEED